MSKSNTGRIMPTSNTACVMPTISLVSMLMIITTGISTVTPMSTMMMLLPPLSWGLLHDYERRYRLRCAGHGSAEKEGSGRSVLLRDCAGWLPAGNRVVQPA
jgi:hypothetical protein